MIFNKNDHGHQKPRSSKGLRAGEAFSNTLMKHLARQTKSISTQESLEKSMRLRLKRARESIDPPADEAKKLSKKRAEWIPPHQNTPVMPVETCAFRNSQGHLVFSLVLKGLEENPGLFGDVGNDGGAMRRGTLQQHLDRKRDEVKRSERAFLSDEFASASWRRDRLAVEVLARIEMEKGQKRCHFLDEQMPPALAREIRRIEGHFWKTKAQLHDWMSVEKFPSVEVSFQRLIQMLSILAEGRLVTHDAVVLLRGILRSMLFYSDSQFESCGVSTSHVYLFRPSLRKESDNGLSHQASEEAEEDEDSGQDAIERVFEPRKKRGLGPASSAYHSGHSAVLSPDVMGQVVRWNEPYYSVVDDVEMTDEIPAAKSNWTTSKRAQLRRLLADL